jgi:hypothetical protein
MPRGRDDGHGLLFRYAWIPALIQRIVLLSVAFLCPSKCIMSILESPQVWSLPALPLICIRTQPPVVVARSPKVAAQPVPRGHSVVVPCDTFAYLLMHKLFSVCILTQLALAEQRFKFSASAAPARSLFILSLTGSQA